MAIMKMDDIKKQQSQFVGELIEKGYYITESYQSNCYPQLHLSNGKDIVDVMISTRSDNEIISAERVTFTVQFNDDVIYLASYFGSSHSVLYTTWDEMKAAHDKSLHRMMARDIINENSIPVTRKNVRLVRNIPGWKTVPMKNLRIVRKSNAYILENTKNNHRKVIFLNK